MRLGVEYPLVKVEVLVGVVLEQQVEVLERLGQEEALHLVLWPHIVHIGHVVHGRVAARVDARILLERLEYAPAVLLVLLLLGDLVQVVERLDRLGPQQVVSIGVTHIHVDRGRRKAIELHNLRTEAGRHQLVHLVAGLGELLGQLHELVDLGARKRPIALQVHGAECQVARQEAHQVVHLGTERVGDELAHECEVVGSGVADEALADALDGVEPVDEQVVVIVGGVEAGAVLYPLLEQVLVVGVAARAQRDHAARELAALGVDVDLRETVGLVQRVDLLADERGDVLEARVARRVRQIFVLDLERGDLGQTRVRRPVRRLGAPLLQVDVRVGNVRGRVEGGQRAVAELVRLGQEHLVAAEVIGAEQAAHDADGDLEEVVEGVHVEAELGVDPEARLVELLVEVHDVDGVERVDDGQAEVEPAARALRDRPTLVLAPRVLLVALPRVQERLHYHLLPLVLSSWKGGANFGLPAQLGHKRGLFVYQIK